MRAIRLVSFLFLGTSALGGQSFSPYSAQSEFLPGPPGALGSGLQGYANPALLAYVEQYETSLAWTTGSARGKWGLFSAFPHLGFGLVHRDLPGKNLTDYRLSMAAGDRRASLGFAYGWSAGNTRYLGRRNHFVSGALLRPSRYLSAGATFTATTGFSEPEGTLDLALRPLGGERLTFFADGGMAVREAEDAKTFWSAGAALELLQGVVISGRYLDGGSIGLGLDLSLGTLGYQTRSRFDEGGERGLSTHALRLGPRESNFLQSRLQSGRRYLNLDLLGPTLHRRFVLFDRARTLSSLLELISRAENDPAIGGIAINLSGMRINPEMAWELRSRLLEFKQAGKHVVAYLDRASIRGYHFASVADRIVMDPAGTIALEGFVAGQTYFKGALEKLGIGFDEWRFFKYKSAFESLSREGMSAADREQWQALIDDFYGLAREEICAQRRLDPEEFDRLVDEETLFLAQDALEKGLVDRLGRWDEVEEAIAELEGGERELLEPESYSRPRDESWGRKPRIAVVYALGVCALDEGIKARRLAREIEAVAENPSIEAMVLRVDSPGGDALASDLVAQALKKCREEKPVIVSQGLRRRFGRILALHVRGRHRRRSKHHHRLHRSHRRLDLQPGSQGETGDVHRPRQEGGTRRPGIRPDRALGRTAAARPQPDRRREAEDGTDHPLALHRLRRQGGRRPRQIPRGNRTPGPGQGVVGDARPGAWSRRPPRRPRHRHPPGQGESRAGLRGGNQPGRTPPVPRSWTPRCCNQDP